MAKKGKQLLRNKKNSQSASPGAFARHGSVKGGRLLVNGPVKKTRAQLFMDELRQEITKAL